MKGLIQDNEYKLIVYKVSRPVETTNYLTLPSIHGPGTENEVQRIDGVQYTKDFVVVQVNIKYSKIVEKKFLRNFHDCFKYDELFF